MEVGYLILGIVIGVFFGFLIGERRQSKIKSKSIADYQNQLNDLNASKTELDKSYGILQEKHNIISADLIETENKLENEITQNKELSDRIARAEVEYRSLKEKLDTQKKEIEELQKQLTTEFENIANRIMKQRSEEFSMLNQKNMGDLIKPVKEKFESFEKKVEDTYLKSKNDQVDLKAELKKLADLNQSIREEASNLTKALKGDVKKQGNWGEVVLERIMERSGLTEGNEYKKQYSDTNDEGKRIQPDIVVFLPDKKHIIIDSKVSLIAYERAINAQSDEETEQHLKEHLLSLKAHIKGLSEKHYPKAQNLNSPDFVLMFLPIEASFSLAIQHDQDLFTFAWDLKVVIVSPSTLLATLRTIASIWQQENQTKNALEIARQSGALYDKFVGFITDMEKIGKNIETTQKTYADAMNKLKDGSGNLVKRADNIKQLGAKTSKSLSDHLFDTE